MICRLSEVLMLICLLVAILGSMPFRKLLSVEKKWIHRGASGLLENSSYLRNASSETKPSARRVVDQLRSSTFTRPGSLCAGSGNMRRDECLVFTPPLTAFFIEGIHLKACEKKGWCFTCEFEKLVKKAKEGNSPLSLVSIMSQMQCIGSHMGNGREEDAHEFLRWVKMPSSSDEETTLMGLTFGGYLRSKVQSVELKKVLLEDAYLLLYSSTESTNRESTSTDDNFDQILGDIGNSWTGRSGNSESETSSPSSSPSPLHANSSVITDLDNSLPAASSRSCFVKGTSTVSRDGFRAPASDEVQVLGDKRRDSLQCPDTHQDCRKFVDISSCRKNYWSRLGCDKSCDNLKGVNNRWRQSKIMHWRRSNNINLDAGDVVTLPPSTTMGMDWGKDADEVEGGVGGG
ncbi:UNVERIFIED_CONTAM: Ubiquitin carboxyl-terminal hydrolase 16 [Sesamum radiatum]|uniref:Ubiquitin carboxyl-terminal hydrolase 16 n=1 Tax=Sesamum radiatum TaxID=300843 RepID=A0AAW2M1N1_SESRA